MKTELDINSNMINWAIRRAGHDLEDFVQKNPKIRVRDWLEKKKAPTVRQLQDFAHKVNVPFGYLFLPQPPKESLSFPFFRTGKTKTKSVSLNVYDTIMLIQRRQEWLTDYLQENEFEPLNYVGNFDTKSDYKDIVADIRQTLNLEGNWASKFSTWKNTLEFLTSKIEEIGIIVSFNSVVENSNKRKIKVEECRGFVLVDSFCPFMFVNNGDAKAAQMFTIIHELAHIWLGESAGFDFKQLQPSNDPLELLCDKVAAEFLVPENLFNDAWQESPDIKKLGRIFKVSPIVIARRALDLGKLTKKAFFVFYNRYMKELGAKKENQPSGGNPYATFKKRVSLTFVAHVDQAVNKNQLLYKDAYKLTSLKGNTYEKFINKYLY
ncbi:ImmA/IrrE family metallo-endopeptidase [Fulvivirgaceae bacterium BMA12]|uniref:ImmA/IrrE family metallo-endopeptidase n=1 Tax=Agaribacillus aureus TaxID=3051825 RepID=A0ABT8KZ52_9BACT|nr:ImmA/IrrE family metallo-endopeptidase [Fulvivirgaceae bacterium BMA12]